jgi:hypothetical protein
MLAAQLSTGLSGNFLMQQFVVDSPGRQWAPVAQPDASTPHSTTAPRSKGLFLVFMGARLAPKRRTAPQNRTPSAAGAGTVSNRGGGASEP